MIQRWKHCDICDYGSTAGGKGLICKLTKRKPDFNNTCSKAKFENILKTKPKEHYMELSIYKKRSFKAYLYGFLGLIIGWALLLGGFYLIYYVNRNIVLEIDALYKTRNLAPFAVSGLGLSVIVYYFNSLVDFYRSKNLLQTKVEDIDAVLNKYRITYDVMVTSNDWQGFDELNVDVRLNKSF